MSELVASKIGAQRTWPGSSAGRTLRARGTCRLKRLPLFAKLPACARAKAHMDVTDGERTLLARGHHRDLQVKMQGTVSKEPTAMTRAVHVPYTVEQDEDGIWCAHAQLRPGVGANGEGDTASAAVADLREALEALIAEFGAPDELTVMVDVA